MKIVSIIPARGGSKGVPKKNIRLLNGKPLIAYTIEASLKSGMIDRTIVSTDCDEIAEISRRYGAEIIKRPPELATDSASSESVLLHALEILEKENYFPEAIVFLQCTSPLRDSQAITEGINKLLQGGYGSVIGVFESFRYFGALTNEEYVPFRKERKRRQEMEPWYCDNGALYVVRREILEKEKNRYGGRIGAVTMSEEDSLEIDNEFDFHLVDSIMKQKESGRNNKPKTELMKMESIIQKRIMESIETKKKVMETLIPNIQKAAELIIEAYKKGGKLICFGNGGSAADAQHIVGELINKLYLERPMLDSIALNTNTSVITAIGNDSSYENIFSRQIESLAKPNDIVLGISTSGNSTNVINALLKAKDLNVKTIALTGGNGGRIRHFGMDIMINVPSTDVARIQESHITIGHIICEIVETSLFGSP